MDVISDFINKYISESTHLGESDKDDSVFIDYCDYVFCGLNLPLCSDFDTAKMLIRRGSVSYL